MPTIQAAVGGQTITVNVTGLLQQALAQTIISASSAQLLSGVTPTDGSQYNVANTPGQIVLGNPSLASQYVLLNGGSQTYQTNGASASYVDAANGGNNTIVNNNPGSALVAVTGSGANVLAGFAGANNFTTGLGGQDAVILDGVANTLNSNASDAISVGGPSTISAGVNAIDSVVVTPGNFLAFSNGSATGVDSIAASNNDVIVIAGPGSASISGSGGFNAFYVDTSVGNVTLNAANSSGAAPDALNFIKDANTGTANVQVANFVGGAAGDAINISGYTGGVYSLTSNATGSAVLNLSDGSSVTFQGVNTAAVQAAIKSAT